MSESKTDTASESQSATASKVAVEMSAERNIGKPLLRCCFDPMVNVECCHFNS